ncbi:MAG TPA: SDR family oxidoreductase [Streptosporangiaceae bacterium]|nr:SDR family oxidoreductase [Streptosporangiaceae bacterium]
MELGLEGRRALVTGSSRGIGRAAAGALAAAGGQVFVSARDNAELTAAARDVGATGYLAGDLDEEATATRLVATAVRELGGLDILIANTGGPAIGSFDSVTVADWEAGWHRTLMSVVHLIRASVAPLRLSSQPRIIIVTSITARQPMEAMVLSNSYRAAVAGLSKSLAAELGPAGITVNNVAPSLIVTDRMEAVHRARAARAGSDYAPYRERLLSSVPLRRFGQPDEVGQLCCFLASAAAGFITGQSIGIDGGVQAGVH